VTLDAGKAAHAQRAEGVSHDATRPKDALHVATALDAGVEQFDTFDRDLIDLSGGIGSPPLGIGTPNAQPLFESSAAYLESSVLYCDTREARSCVNV
jgi:hypothetical protein